MCELDYKESWTPKNWCFWTVVLEKTLESPLDSKEITSVNPKGNQSWIFIGRTDAEAEAPILWPPDTENWFIGKDSDAKKDWRQEEKGMTEDEMVGRYHQTDGHEFEQALGVGDGLGSLAYCSPWGCKESDTTKWLNWCLLHWQADSLPLAPPRKPPETWYYISFTVGRVWSPVPWMRDISLRDSPLGLVLKWSPFTSTRTFWKGPYVIRRNALHW